ncbi:MAG: radical SAM protein, partial [Firmicutes bacterium]|nr:radical SAM protein [Bacillota bacterium]
MASILLVYPQPEQLKDTRFGFSINLLYLSAILKQYGHDVCIKDYSVEEINFKELNILLCSIDVTIIEFDSYPLKRSTNISTGELLTTFIKQNHRHIKVIAFGYDCILFPRHVANTDFTFINEPEKNINHVVNLLLRGEKLAPFKFYNTTLESIDELPFPDRDILSDYIVHGGTLHRKPNLAKSTLIQTSRGCLNTCTFCQRKGWFNNYREHTAEYVVQEFKLIKDQGYVNVWITDDNFTFNLSRGKRILKILSEEKIIDGMKIALSSWVNIDLDFLKLAKDANVSLISFGIESANEKVLQYFDKKIDLSKTKKLIHFADDIGIYTVGNFIIGAPMETEETINKTFEYIRQIPIDQVNIKILDYMKGSKLYSSLPPTVTQDKRHLYACKENGLNIFSLTYLKSKIKIFKQDFKDKRK